jgi:hypothetical protein
LAFPNLCGHSLGGYFALFYLFKSAEENRNSILEKNYKGLKLKKAEHTNFGHIDAAIPGFMKGITYVFEK